MARTKIGKCVEEYMNKAVVIGSMFDENLPDNALFSSIRGVIKSLSPSAKEWADFVTINKGKKTEIRMRLAHTAVIVNGLPRFFKQWDLTMYTAGQRISVASLAAYMNRLPKGFNDWAIADAVQWSVAHAYAARRDMPSDFNQWDLETKTGVSVRDVQNHRNMNQGEKK